MDFLLRCATRLVNWLFRPTRWPPLKERARGIGKGKPLPNVVPSLRELKNFTISLNELEKDSGDVCRIEADYKGGRIEWQLFLDYAVEHSGSVSIKSEESFKDIFASITDGSHWTSITIRNYGLTTNFTTNFDRVMFTYRGSPVSLNDLHKMGGLLSPLPPSPVKADKDFPTPKTDLHFTKALIALWPEVEGPEWHDFRMSVFGNARDVTTGRTRLHQWLFSESAIVYSNEQDVSIHAHDLYAHDIVRLMMNCLRPERIFRCDTEFYGMQFRGELFDTIEIDSITEQVFGKKTSVMSYRKRS